MAGAVRSGMKLEWMGWDGTGWGWGWDGDGLTENHDEPLVWRPANFWRKLLVRILRAKTMVSRQPGGWGKTMMNRRPEGRRILARMMSRRPEGRGKTMMSRRREFLARIFWCKFFGANFSRVFF